MHCPRHYLSGAIALLLSLITLMGCGNKWRRKLSEKELRSLIGELYKADCLMDTMGDRINDTMRLAIEQEIFTKYHLTRSDFDSIVFHYNTEKPLYFADIVRRAALDINKELAMLNPNGSDLPFEEALINLMPPSEISSYSLEQIIPINYYPRYIQFTQKSNWVAHSVLVTNHIPKNTEITTQIVVQGLPSSLQSHPEWAPILEISYYTADSIPLTIEKRIIQNGETSLSLTFPEKKEAGRLTIALYHLGDPEAPSYPLYIREIRTSCIRGLEESEVGDDRLLLYDDRLSF